MPFVCSICEEESTRICVLCTKDTCANHLCEKCGCCSDCCGCEVPLTESAEGGVIYGEPIHAEPVHPEPAQAERPAPNPDPQPQPPHPPPDPDPVPGDVPEPSTGPVTDL